MSKTTKLASGFVLGALLFLGAPTYANALNLASLESASMLQKQTITGEVLDATGAPVIGATVIIKGTTNGDITNVDGKFTVQAAAGEELEISYIGYETKYVPVVSGQTNYKISVKNAVEVEEIVVTALGMTREKKALGYAMTEIKGDEIVAANTLNPAAAIQGKAAGVSVVGSSGGVMGGTRILIRGVSTLSGNNQPIFVVDGVILDNAPSDAASGDATNDFGNQLKNLNSDDFESMSILKGSAATALYGSRGINGAVVITTKSGKGGKGFGVSVTQTTSIEWVYKSPDFQNEFGRGNMVGAVKKGKPNRADGSSNIFDAGAHYYEKDAAGNMVRSLRSGEVADWGPRFDGGDIIGFDGKVTPYRAYENNMLDAYELGVKSNTNITIRGNSDKIDYYFSDSYNYNKGTFPGNKFNRNSLLMKATYRMSKAITLDASVNIVQSTGKNPPYDFGRMFWYGSFTREYDTNYWKDKYPTEHGGVPSTKYGDEYGAVPGMAMWFNLDNRNTVRKETMIIPVVKLQIKPLEWMSVNAEYNMNYYTTKQETKNLGKGYQNEGNDNDQGGYYGLELTDRIQKTGKVSVNFNETFGDFSTSLVVGGEWYGTERAKVATNTEGGLIVPGQYFLANSKKTVKSSAAINDTKNIYSAYFLASLGWKDQLYLDVTGRNDWSSALVYSNAQGNDSYFYPSVSGSWIFSQSFNKPAWFSFGKLRASWAQVGNDTDPYTINSGYGLESIQLESGMAYVNTFTRTLIDPGLRPERKTSIEFGLDVRFLQNRIGLDVTYYKENTRDQIIKIPAPIESGLENQLINAGNIQNQGVEIAINTTPIRKDNFQWDLNFIFTRNRNKVISLHQNTGEYQALESGDLGSGAMMSVAYIGGEFGALLTNAIPRKFENKEDPSDPRNGMNMLEWDDSYYGASYIRNGNIEQYGNTNPKFEGSFYNSFRYKNIDLNFLIDMRFGGMMASYSSRYGTERGVTKTSLYGRPGHGGIEYTSKYAQKAYGTFSDGIIPDGVFAPGTKVTTTAGNKEDVSGRTYLEVYNEGKIEPTAASFWHAENNDWGAGVVTDNWVSEVKYIALRNVSVGYNFPTHLTQKIKLSNLRVSLDAHNLCYLYNSLPNNINPESFLGSSSYAYRELTFSPYTATYAISIKFNL